jgi:hypothetical protein
MAERKQIHINVNAKIANLANAEEYLVNGNNDYEVVFSFDGEWDGVSAKTAMFVFGRNSVAVPFEGNVCDGVSIEGSTICAIGVFAGEIKTTTGAVVKCIQSIRDIGEVPKPPTPEVYDIIMALLDKAIQAHTELPTGGKKGQVLTKKSEEDYDTEWTSPADEKGTIVKVNGESMSEFDADTKLDKITSTGGRRVYGIEPDGTQATYAVGDGTGNIARRTTGGNLNVPEEPLQGTHAASKKYVDDQLGDIQSALEELHTYAQSLIGGGAE